MELYHAIEHDAKYPPLYSLGGKDSIFRPNYLFNRITYFTDTILLLTTFKIAYSHKTSLETDSKAIGKISLIMMCGLACSQGIKFVFQNYKKPDLKYHNCATWIVEKLKNLNIDEIDKDLNSKWSDYIAYVPTFHLGTKQESIDAFKSSPRFIGGLTNNIMPSNSKVANFASSKCLN